ncbi:probable protein phosphatase 2C 40 [Andrographis paniculata]|uniref:probable protein phosphatase 2C 40 n=1 Tax=Andrographis paniculata TaxID=175694 RepID=UPI0021E86799|nr:probable protein phosphatase 2C 40 [Andrographis paniculata]
MMMSREALDGSEGEIKVSFGYRCSFENDDSTDRSSNNVDIPSVGKLRRASSSFSCLSGAALSANATLANTNICNGLFVSEILPSLDSPNSFRRISSSPKLEFLSSSLQSSMSTLSFSPSSPSEMLDRDSISLKSMSAPSGSESLLEVQIAGGAAGEDRVQAVCSEENGWLFCAIYDGFNGRDAADFLAGILYEKVACRLNLLDWEIDQASSVKALDYTNMLSIGKNTIDENEKGDGFFKQSILNSLQQALNEAESEFLYMVEQEMDDRPDLVSIGSCVLLVLLHGKNLYLLCVGDSRAVLATYGKGFNGNNASGVRAVQLTDIHTVDDEVERTRLLNNHPDDPSTIVAGKVKGKLKVTRAFGVGYLKKKEMNDALMGILRVRNLVSPPYVSLEPSLSVHEVSSSDHFVVLASDGLFDFFTNDEVVKFVHSYILKYPCGDPAKFLVQQLVARAATSAGFSKEELMSVPAGRRRKYHDDITVIVIVLGTNKRTTKASTCLSN